MRYYIGVDGGATKTKAVVGDEAGRVLGVAETGPSNYQVVGIEFAMWAVEEAVNKALALASLADGPTGTAGAVFGLAGADSPADFGRLTEALAPLMGEANYKVVNDCWVALRGGTRNSYGVVFINGTGGNAAGRNRSGKTAILRGMDYEGGNRGGAGDLIREALHWAFRSEEGTGPVTRLEVEIPKAVGMDSMAAIASLIRSGEASPAMGMPIVPLVFHLANKGDQVCQEILVRIGDAMGQAAGGLSRRLGIDDESIDVVMAGGVWKGENPLMRDQFATALHRLAPKARPLLPLFEPAVGGYLLALEEAGVGLTDQVWENLAATAPPAV